MKRILTSSILTLVATTILPGCIYLAGGGAAITTIFVAHDRRSVGTVIDDNLIELRIRKGILTNGALRGQTHINVTSVNGIVLLTGETPAISQRDDVIRIARGIRAVRQTVNEIRIADKVSLGGRTNDSWITSKIKAKLVKARGISDATRINVHTAYGVVYLMGLMTRTEGDAAAEVARRVRRVKRVVKIFEYVD